MIRFAAVLALALPCAHGAIPWDLASLQRAPQATPAPDVGEEGVTGVYLEGPRWKGKPTKFFAWYAVPKVAGGRAPAMVLIHGGGGTAFSEWVRMWSARGYAAIAMDTVGTVPAKAKGFNVERSRPGDQGPEGWGGFAQVDDPVEDQWTYHAVAKAVLAHSFLRSLPGVDPRRIGVTGISWGGYLTSIVAGVDPRFRFAAPVYGCGFLGEDSAWLNQFEKMGPEKSRKWLDLWDPSRYLAQAKMPFLWVNGTNDFAYPMGSWRKSYLLPRGARTLALRVAMKHSHPDGAKPEEIFTYADAMLRGGKGLARLTGEQVSGRTFTVRYKPAAGIKSATLHCTEESGKWQDRKWTDHAAELDPARRTARATAPESARACFLNLTDAAGLVVSSSHAEFGSPAVAQARKPWIRGAPDPPSPYVLKRVFPQFSFKDPVFLAEEPTSNRMIVAEYHGKIWSFDRNDPKGEKDLFLDMGRGVSAFSFHPRYRENGQVFVFSHIDPKKPREGQKSRVSRFVADRSGPVTRLRRDSEQIIIDWPAGGHNGGEAIIGPDGYLYISTGDGTSGSDRNSSGQGVDDLLAVMMRLDVDRPEAGKTYSIPKDNPFVNTPGARGEIWAYGFRNPWRFSFDPVTGRPWVGDVGQDLWEMIELSHSGANHGWSVREGSHPFHPNAKPGPTPFTAPVVEHHHTECRSITGGYVYQGDKFPELRGTYVYGDYEYGKMWSLRYDAGAKKVTAHKEIADTAVRISSFAVGRDGSFWALDYDKGEIHELARRPPGPAMTRFPRKLSETGLFASVKEHRLAPGVEPYTINAPFWSDGADKERFVALMGARSVKFDPKRAWEFADGTVTVKSFTLGGRRIETRIVVKQDNHWVGYSYAWNDAQTDAALVGALGMDRTYRVKDTSAPDGTREQTWHFPSRNECMFCHSRAAGFVLGLNTAQMNKGGQLDQWSKLGLFEKPLPQETHAAYPNPADAKAPMEARVKAFLAVNCAMCHVSDGGGNADLELAWDTPMEKAKMINERPLHDTFGAADARIVAPGSPERSTLWQRLNRRGSGQMPPTSSNLVDRQSVELVGEWIRSLARQHGANVNTATPITNHSEANTNP